MSASFKVVLLLMAAIIVPDHIVAAPSDVSETPRQLAESLDIVELDQYLESYIADPVSRAVVPGATVAIVHKDGSVLLRGYGVRSLSSNEPVDPAKTLFRVGSITKVFTAIAVLQLVDEGIVDLDQDVNSYLNTFDIQSPFNQPITVRHLLTHSAGLDGDITFAGVARDSETFIPRDKIGEFFRPVHEPGEVIAYDNSALGLLGLVLEDVYDEAYRDIIQTRILAPLEMTNSVIGLPEDRTVDAAACHILEANGSWTECRDQLLLRDNFKAAGDLSTTASDMARFMISFLNGLKTADGYLLSAEAYSALVDMSQNRPHASLGSYGLIPIEIGPVGYGAFGHNGGIKGFKSSFVVSPNDEIGAFISTNGSPPSVTASVPRPENDVTLTGLLEFYMHGADAANWPAEYSEIQRLAPGFSPSFLSEFGMTKRHSDSASKVGCMTEPLVEALENIDGKYVAATTTLYTGLAGRMLLPLLVDKQRVSIIGPNKIRINRESEYCQVGDKAFADIATQRHVIFEFSELNTFLVSQALQRSIKLRWHQNPWINTFPLVPSLVLLVSGLALIKQQIYTYRLFGAAVGIAALIITTSLLLELEFAQQFLLYKDNATLVMIWRTAYQVALLCLATAVLSLAVHELGSDARRGQARRWTTGCHLAAMWVAGVYVISVSAYWGLVGFSWS